MAKVKISELHSIGDHLLSSANSFINELVTLEMKNIGGGGYAPYSNGYPDHNDRYYNDRYYNDRYYGERYRNDRYYDTRYYRR